MFRNRYQALSKLERRIFWIAIAIAVVLLAFAVTLISDIINAPDMREAVVSAMPFVISFIAFSSAGLILNGRSQAGAWLIQLGTFVVLIFSVTQSDGFGYSSAFILLAITIYIPLQAIKSERASIAFWVGVIGAISIILLDTFWTGSRVHATPDDVLAGSLLSALLAIILGYTTISQFKNYRIHTKLLVFALGTGLVSILSVAIFTNLAIRQTLTRQTGDSLVSAAKQTMGEIDNYIGFNIDTITSEAQNPQVVAFVKSTFGEQRATQGEMVAILNSLIQRDPSHIDSYTLIHRTGIVVADTHVDNIGYSESDRDYFTFPRSSGKAFVSPIRYSLTSSDYEFYIGVPVMDEGGTFLGVMSVRFHSSVLNEIIASNIGLSGEGSYSILLDEFNLVVADGRDSKWVSHTLVTPAPEVFATLQNDNRILRDIGGKDISLNMPDFAEKLQTLPKDKRYFNSTDDTWGSPVEAGVAESSTTPFRLVYVQPQSFAFAAIAQQQQITVAVALITGLVILFASFLVSRNITDPLVNLATVAEDITSGDLSARASYEIDDEVGVLAKSFNRMTSQLQDTLGGLERRVAERTSDAEMARLLSERRAQDLLSISEISRIISTEQKQETLLSLITRLVSERFDFYHVGIFLIDDTSTFAVLQAANSEGGQRMLARGHRLEVGQTGIVGDVAKLGKPRIALDVGSDAVYFNNPDLPETRSEMALPLSVRGQVIGVLDVQSTKPGAFTDSDANTLSILADQVATAIQNARLFGQIQQAREEAEALYNQYIKTDWTAFAKQETKIGYQHSVIGGKLIEKPVEAEEIQAAIQKGEVVVIDGRNSRTHQPSVVIPVKLRGQTIGVLSVKGTTNNRKWSEEEIKLAQAISDRLALALDNARLLQQSQRNAAKEAKIGEVTAKIGASINMRSVLQTAVEELGRALPGSDVVIQFQQDGKA